MNQQDANIETITIEDLQTQDAEEIKGGPNPKTQRAIVLQSSVAGDWNGDGQVSSGDFNPWR